MMQSIGLQPTVSRSGSVEYHVDNRKVESKQMTCPDCGTLCPPIGKVKNNWYSLCRCGIYIQLCTTNDDYTD